VKKNYYNTTFLKRYFGVHFLFYERRKKIKGRELSKPQLKEYDISPSIRRSV
jgi:hypothetical protein